MDGSCDTEKAEALTELKEKVTTAESQEEYDAACNAFIDTMKIPPEDRADVDEAHRPPYDKGTIDASIAEMKKGDPVAKQRAQNLVDRVNEVRGAQNANHKKSRLAGRLRAGEAEGCGFAPLAPSIASRYTSESVYGAIRPSF